MEGVMENEKEAENLTKAPEIGSKSGSPSNLAEQDMDVHTENSPLPHCMPGYKTCAPGQVIAVEGQCLDQMLHSSAQSLQHTIPCVSKFVPVCLWETKPADRDSQPGVKIVSHPKPSVSSSSSACGSNYEGSNSIKTKVTADAKASITPLDSRPHLPTSLSNSHHQTIRPVQKASNLSSGVESAGPKSHYHSFANQGQGGFLPRNVNSNYRSNGQTAKINGNFNMNDKRILHRNSEGSCELVRGPRSNRLNGCLNSHGEKDNLNLFVRKNQFNKPDFRIMYVRAKFFMIKSYSEDDIHKSIKYNVWASTPNGNKKLDAAYRDAEVQSKDKDSKCPIFLFFSVNASGQFVGLAEMIGPVDFKKTMDFWQQDKWSGFFPVTWHIVKDIPNRFFHSITLENNDNRSVTFSRDTQEIMHPQGLKMLHIFKSYPIVTSILDDFEFYEKKEKSLHTRRSHQPAFPNSEVDVNDDTPFLGNLEAAVAEMDLSARPKRTSSHPKPSLVTPPRNLLIDNLRSQKRS